MNLFYNPRDNRLRAGWRLLLQFLLMVFLLGLGQYLLGLSPLQGGFLFDRAITAIAFVGSTWVAVRLLDRRTMPELGLHVDARWWRQLGVGLAIGGLAVGVIFVLQLGGGWVDITGFGWQRSWNGSYPLPLISYLAGMVLVGFYEELIFRGYQITNMIEGLYSGRSSTGYAVAGALVFSSCIFGLLHAGNPNASFVSTVNIMFAGAVLAYPYLVTGSLAMPVGLHIAWNFFQGGVFGLPVSGTPARSSLLQIRETGPDLFTGGSFGPEAGLTGIMGLFLVVLLSYQYLRNAGYDTMLHPDFVQVSE